MKKYRNWKGLILMVCAVLPLLIFPLLAYWSFQGNDGSGAIAFLVGSVVVCVIEIVLVPKFFKQFHEETQAKNAFVALPEQTAEAMVFGRNKRTVDDRAPTKTFCYVTFEMEGGERKTFRVAHDVYATAKKGERGQLVFKDSDGYDFFVAFRRQANECLPSEKENKEISF